MCVCLREFLCVRVHLCVSACVEKNRYRYIEKKRLECVLRVCIEKNKECLQVIKNQNMRNFYLLHIYTYFSPPSLFSFISLSSSFLLSELGIFSKDEIEKSYQSDERLTVAHNKCLRVFFSKGNFLNSISFILFKKSIHLNIIL